MLRFKGIPAPALLEGNLSGHFDPTLQTCRTCSEIRVVCPVFRCANVGIRTLPQARTPLAGGERIPNVSNSHRKKYRGDGVGTWTNVLLKVNSEYLICIH